MKERSIFDECGYRGYLLRRLSHRGFMRFYRRTLAILRPTLWIRRIFRLLTYLILLLESGVILLFLSLLSLLLLPVVMLGIALLLPSALREKRQALRRLLPSLEGRRIILLSEERRGLARRLRHDGYFVLVICRGRRHFSFSDSSAQISPMLYFSLRQRIASTAERVVCVEIFSNDLAG